MKLKLRTAAILNLCKLTTFPVSKSCRGCTMDWEIICLLLLSGLSSQVKLYISSQVIESLIKCPTQYGKEDPSKVLKMASVVHEVTSSPCIECQKPVVKGCQILTCNHISCRQCLRKTSTQKHPRSLPVVFCKTCKRSVAAIDEERKRYDCNICGKKQTVLCENCAMFFCNRCVLTLHVDPRTRDHFFLSFTTKSGNSANKVADTGVIPKECPDKSVRFFGSYGTADGEFVCPKGICSDHMGRIIIVETFNHRIQVFDKNGNFLLKFGSLGNKPGQFKTPTGVASNSEAHIIVSDSGNNRIQIFNAYGDFIHEFDGCGSDADKFNRPLDVCVNENDQILVADFKNLRVQLFTRDGIYIYSYEFDKTFAAFSNSPFEPQGVFSKKGKFFVTDVRKSLYVVLDEKLETARYFGRLVSWNGAYMNPNGITVDEKGRRFLTDCISRGIQVYREDNEYLGLINTDMASPSGICFTAEGDLIVSDSGCNRIGIFSEEFVYRILESFK
ncbi:E3 ubiquitin-protein ligase TRIM71 [Nymphon striatum]|nr:E3 ubiquitin-protein ligase TRIM71 [Nymphon striatum]